VKGFGKEVRDMLTAAGCAFLRHGKGDHDIWSTPSGQRIVVPVKIMSPHTANAILKDAGLPKAF
jgi:predicted RNA binding protein YcfA (HicA-like mRNA interferase family)